MTPSEMRLMFYGLMFDTYNPALQQGTFFDQEQGDLVMDMAHEHIGNLILAQKEHLLVTSEQSIAISNPQGNDVVTLTMDKGVHRILIAHISNYDAAGSSVATYDPSLKIIELEAVPSERTGTLRIDPPCFVINQKIAFVEPAKKVSGTIDTLLEVGVFYVYVPSSPDSWAETAEPDPSLPDGFHGLVPVYAALLGLTAENRDTAEISKRYMEMAQAVGLSVTQRTEAPA